MTRIISKRKLFVPVDVLYYFQRAELLEMVALQTRWRVDGVVFTKKLSSLFKSRQYVHVYEKDIDMLLGAGVCAGGKSSEGSLRSQAWSRVQGPGSSKKCEKFKIWTHSKQRSLKAWKLELIFDFRHNIIFQINTWTDKHSLLPSSFTS